jgi:uncharacterized damage-inducible protein DinB
MPAVEHLIEETKNTDDWYVSYADELSTSDFAQPVEFSYTNGTPARMTRGEIILHVCLHGTYHRGNAGVLLLKNDITPNQDRPTDFLETVACVA